MIRLFVAVLGAVFVGTIADGPSVHQVAAPSPPGPEIVLQTRHSGIVRAATFFQSGRRLATAAGEISIWDVSSRLKIRTIRVVRDGSRRSIGAVAAHPAGRLLVAAEDRYLHAFDPSTGELKQSLDWITANDLDVSSDGTRLVVAGYDAVHVLRMDPASSAPLSVERTIPLQGRSVIWKARFATADAGRIIAIDSSRVFALDTASGALVWANTPYKKLNNALAVSADGQIVIAGTDQSGSLELKYRVQFLSTQNGQLLRTIELPGAYPRELALSPDSMLLAIGGTADLAFGVYDAKTDNLLHGYRGGGSRTSSLIIRFDPTGRLLVSVIGNEVKLHDALGGGQVADLGQPIESVHALAIRPGGGSIAIAGDEAAYILDLQTDLSRLPLRVPRMGWTQAVAWSPDARRVYVTESTLGGDSTHLFDATTGARVGDVEPLPQDKRPYVGELPGNVSFHPDGQRIALGMPDGRVEIRRLSDRRLLRVLPPPKGVDSRVATPVYGLHFAADGRRLYVSAGESSDSPRPRGALRVFDVDTGRQIGELVSNALVGPIAEDGERRRFASGGTTDRIRIYDSVSGNVVMQCGGSQFGSPVKSLSFSPDGAYLFAGGFFGVVRTCDARTGAFVREQTLHDDTVTALAADSRTGHLVSGSSDGTLKIHAIDRAGNLSTRVTVVSMGPDDYITLTPDGYYRSTPRGGRAVAYRLEDRVFPFEQFDLRYNRPDRVISALGSADSTLLAALESAYQRRLRRLGIAPAALRALQSAVGPPDISALPVVTVDARDLPVATNSRFVTLRLTATASADTQLVRLKMTVNEGPAHALIENGGAGTVSTPDGAVLSGSRFEGRVRVTLTTRFGGRNRISISAIDSKGRESLIEQLEIACTALPERAPARFVVALGVSTYAESRFNLRYAHADAIAVARLFASPEAKPALTPPAKTLVLTDTQVTREALEQVKTFLARAGVDDSVILFVAGHGLLDREGKYWFAAHDIEFARPEARAIAYDDLEGVLTAIPAREKLLLLDTCHAGEADLVDNANAAPGQLASAPEQGVSARALTPSSRPAIGYANSVAVVETLFANLAHGSGAQVIAAAAGAEYAFEHSGHGVFTASLLEGLGERKAAENNRDPITVSALRAYVARRVREATGGRQTPTARRISSEFDFIVY